MTLSSPATPCSKKLLTHLLTLCAADFEKGQCQFWNDLLESVLTPGIACVSWPWRGPRNRLIGHTEYSETRIEQLDHIFNLIGITQAAAEGGDSARGGGQGTAQQQQQAEDDSKHDDTQGKEWGQGSQKSDGRAMACRGTDPVGDARIAVCAGSP